MQTNYDQSKGSFINEQSKGSFINEQSKQFKRWSPEEEATLLREISESLPIYAIARAHDRSKKAIEIRLLDIGIKMLGKGSTFDEVKEKTNMTEEQINERIKTVEEEKKTKASTYNQPTSSTYSPTINTINTIVQRLDILSNHIKMLDSTISKLAISTN